ncbi:hypothetical protein [Streptomyces tendae]|uniref:hypothetical protein n=1 Tax=Streptomyces tendae TaxID=1932 RepID=UPI00371F2485
MSPLLPPVDPSVTAQLVAALTPRLRKRLDAGVAKLAGRPVARDGDIVRLAVDDDTDLELHAPDGIVTTAEAIRCGCLLAPDCLHRAAAASAAPVAEMPDPVAEIPDPVAGEPSLTKAPRTAAPTSAPATTLPATTASAADDAPAGAADPAGAGAPAPESATPAQRTAAAALHDAAAAVLEAGADGAGAVLQAELLRAAHTARLAGLPRAAGRAVAAVTALRAARDADPAHRLGDLTTALRDVLLLAHRLPEATGPELAGLRGRVRQPYTPDGSLRLYGLFAEPVLTSTGYAGTVTWTADAAGRLYTVPDVAPGGAERAAGSADRAVRIGDTSLTHRELSRAGLAVSGATVSPTGRLGAGAGVRAVRAPGVSWHAEPLDRLWTVPVAEQIARALAGDLDVPKAKDTDSGGDAGEARDAGDGTDQPTVRDGRDGRDLLFLDVTLIGTVREAAGECLLADCAGLTIRLAAAHDDPALPDRENLRLLALLAHPRAPGTRLRVVARLTPAPLPRAVLLAASRPTDPDAHLDLGLDRLRRADLPAEPTAGTSVDAGNSQPAPTVQPATAPGEAPVHLLRRRVHQAASGGRRVLAFPGSKESEAARLRRCGLGTAGELLTALHASAAERARDPFGRLLPADTGRFATAWLGAAVYTEEVDRALCAAAWGASSPGLDSR